MSIIYGVAENDADYQLTIRDKGKLIWVCPYYSRWKGILVRCYSEKSIKKYPSYFGCSVSDDWLTFSNFRSWMEGQEWHGMHLDKDILSPCRKIYSKETCIFIPEWLNSFCTNEKRNSKYKCGVNYIERHKRYQASIRIWGE